jgi:hypothetical protein
LKKRRRKKKKRKRRRGKRIRMLYDYGNREEWRRIVEKVKTFKELSCSTLKKRKRKKKRKRRKKNAISLWK